LLLEMRNINAERSKSSIFTQSDQIADFTSSTTRQLKERAEIKACANRIVERYSMTDLSNIFQVEEKSVSRKMWKVVQGFDWSFKTNRTRLVEIDHRLRSKFQLERIMANPTEYDPNHAICTAYLNSTVVARVVATEAGCLPFSLPPDFRATASLRCTDFNGITQHRRIPIVAPQVPTPCTLSSGNSDTLKRLYLAPQAQGYYEQDLSGRKPKMTWVSTCKPLIPCYWNDTSLPERKEKRASSLRGSQGTTEEERATEDRLLQAPKRPRWVQVIGDSVTRRLVSVWMNYLDCDYHVFIATGRNGRSIDFIECVVGRSEEELMLLTFQWFPDKFLQNLTAWDNEVFYGRTYLEMFQLREAFNAEKAPGIPDDLEASATLFSFGYHGAMMQPFPTIQRQVGLVLDKVQALNKELDAPAHRFQLLLNVYPLGVVLPWLRMGQVVHRSVFYTYLTNKYCAEEALKRGITVVDIATLGFVVNDQVHMDAVHPGYAMDMQSHMRSQICTPDPLVDERVRKENKLNKMRKGKFGH